MTTITYDVLFFLLLFVAANFIFYQLLHKMLKTLEQLKFKTDSFLKPVDLQRIENLEAAVADFRQLVSVQNKKIAILTQKLDKK
ncbi:hypothetical protein [Candidatus Albibeggiatoa sp. nov. BB20]|uniref:hypothetical protein n=1 Tax=Candidatus Albibeggiatoa sp. nov. BB20 TaxID=3162723 RepID=UPI00336592C5